MLRKVTPLDKVPNNQCPTCHENAMAIYYQDETSLEIGAVCEACGRKGFYVGGRLVVMAT